MHMQRDAGTQEEAEKKKQDRIDDVDSRSTTYTHQTHRPPPPPPPPLLVGSRCYIPWDLQGHAHTLLLLLLRPVAQPGGGCLDCSRPRSSGVGGQRGRQWEAYEVLWLALPKEEVL